MQVFQTIFEEYGAGCTAVMGRYINNEALYPWLPGMLFQDADPEKPGTALKADNPGGAFEAVHMRKAAVDNPGLVPLYWALEKLTELLRTGEKRENYPALHEAFREGLRGVRQYDGSGCL